MRVVRSNGEPDLSYVTLSDAERDSLRKALKGAKGIARELRRLLK